MKKYPPECIVALKDSNLRIFIDMDGDPYCAEITDGLTTSYLHYSDKKKITKLKKLLCIDL